MSQRELTLSLEKIQYLSLERLRGAAEDLYLESLIPGGFFYFQAVFNRYFMEKNLPLANFSLFVIVFRNSEKCGYALKYLSAQAQAGLKYSPKQA